MSVSDNKSLARRFINEVFVQGRTESVDELVADDFTPHTWPGVEPGRESLRQAMKRIAAGLSNVRMDIEDVIAEDDKVVVRLTSSATQTGEFMKLPASGKRYSISETHIFRIVNGKIREHWHNADMLGMMRQLGALPQPAHAGTG